MDSLKEITNEGERLPKSPGGFRSSEVLGFPKEIKAEPQKQNFQRFALGETACKHSAMISSRANRGNPRPHFHIGKEILWKNAA